MNAYFCNKTGVRIVAPGVCKAVDPKNGQDEFSEQPALAAKEKPAEKAASQSAEKAKDKNQ